MQLFILQIEELTMEVAGPQFDRPVLRSLGKQLIRLHIDSERKLDLIDLLPCICLEKLTFSDDAALRLSRPLTETEIKQLLPKLKKISDFCSDDESHVCTFFAKHFQRLFGFSCSYGFSSESSE